MKPKITRSRYFCKRACAFLRSLKNGFCNKHQRIKRLHGILGMCLSVQTRMRTTKLLYFKRKLIMKSLLLTLLLLSFSIVSIANENYILGVWSKDKAHGASSLDKDFEIREEKIQ